MLKEGIQIIKNDEYKSVDGAELMKIISAMSSSSSQINLPAMIDVTSVEEFPDLSAAVAKGQKKQVNSPFSAIPLRALPFQPSPQPTSESKTDLVRLSKAMSAILRHRLADNGLKADEEGYVKLSDFMKLKNINKYTIDEIKQVVESNDKQRFKITTKNNIYYIRANQGHSGKTADMLDDEKMLELIEVPEPVCIHGTTNEAFKSIQKSGLKIMGRKHIHCASGLPKDRRNPNSEDEGVVSGARWNSEVFLYIDMEKAMQDGIKFYRSANGVILTEGINGTLPYQYVNNVKYKKH